MEVDQKREGEDEGNFDKEGNAIKTETKDATKEDELKGHLREEEWQEEEKGGRGGGGGGSEWTYQVLGVACFSVLQCHPIK